MDRKKANNICTEFYSRAPGVAVSRRREDDVSDGKRVLKVFILEKTNLSTRRHEWSGFMTSPVTHCCACLQLRSTFPAAMPLYVPPLRSPGQWALTDKLESFTHTNTHGNTNKTNKQSKKACFLIKNLYESQKTLSAVGLRSWRRAVCSMATAAAAAAVGDDSLKREFFL